MMMTASLGSQKMTKQQQLEDLNRRLVLLEGERKAQYETAQTNIRQNQQIIKQMKTENKTFEKKIHWTFEMKAKLLQNDFDFSIFLISMNEC